MPSIDSLPASLRSVALRFEADPRVSTADGNITLEKLQRASELHLLTADEYVGMKTALLNASLTGGSTPLATPKTASVYGAVDAGPELSPQRTGFSDLYAIPEGSKGLISGQSLVLPVPKDRQGLQVSNVEVQYHAPIRDWDAARNWENKPTYANVSFDDRLLQKKFVDPGADAGNQPETDNIYLRGNSDDPGTLGAAGKTLRITADNRTIPPDEQAMTVNWVKITYQAPAKEVKAFTFKGAALPNQEWQGKWVSPGEKLTLDVDPKRSISRVEVHWSDKPDDVPYDQPGKWALGTMTLDGVPFGKAHQHVGSPSWNFFDPAQPTKGKHLEINTEACPLKVFDVKVFYAD